MPPAHFISCDWGTSRLRLRLVDAGSGHVTVEHTSDRGVASVGAAWQSRQGQAERLSLYTSVLEEALSMLAQAGGYDLSGLPIVISGMASSSIGLIELPYARLPFALDGSGTVYHVLDLPGGSHRVYLLSGVRGAEDVMRGEETELIGLWTLPGAGPSSPPDPAVFVLPGTHAKHVRVEDGCIVDFHTYMTGEVFAALSMHTVLSASVGRLPDDLAAAPAFRDGVRDATGGNLLNRLFRVRARTVLGAAASDGQAAYLSGLLVGYELAELQGCTDAVVLAAGARFQSYYAAALHVLGLSGRTLVLDPELVDRAVPLGQQHLLAQRLV